MSTPDFPDWTTPIGVERAALVVDGLTIAPGGASPTYYDISAFGALTFYVYCDSGNDVELVVTQSIEPRNLPVRSDRILCRNGNTAIVTLSVAAPALLLSNNSQVAGDNLHVTVVGTSNTVPVRFDSRQGGWALGDEWIQASMAFSSGQFRTLTQSETGRYCQGQVCAEFRVSNVSATGDFFILSPSNFQHSFWIANTAEMTNYGGTLFLQKMIALPAYQYQLQFHATAAFTSEVSVRMIPCAA